MMREASGVQTGQRRDRVNPIIDHQLAPELVTDIVGNGRWNTGGLEIVPQLSQQETTKIRVDCNRPFPHNNLRRAFSLNDPWLHNMPTDPDRQPTQYPTLSQQGCQLRFVVHAVLKRQDRHLAVVKPGPQLFQHRFSGGRFESDHDDIKIVRAVAGNHRGMIHGLYRERPYLIPIPNRQPLLLQSRQVCASGSEYHIMSGMQQAGGVITSYTTGPHYQ